MTAGWKKTTIGEISSIFDGPHATPTKTQSGPWFLSISSLNNGRLDLQESAHLSELDFERWTRRVTPREGDLLFSYETKLGAAALMPGGLRACLGRRMALLRVNPEKVDPRFLLYAYMGPDFQDVIRKRSIHGATVDRIPLSELSGWPIRIPEIRKQRVIGATLGALDDKIRVNERIARTSRKLSEAEFTIAVHSPTTEEHELAGITESLTRGITPRYTDDGSELTILNQKCVRGGRVSLEPSRKTDASKVTSVKRLRHNDVLINSTGVGTLGRVARWTFDIPATVDSHLTIVRFDPAKTDVLCAAFSMLAAQPEIEAMGEGSTGQTELSRAKLGAMRIRLPPLETCRQIRPRLEALETRGDTALAESEALAELRDALLPKLMSGEIRVRDAEKIVEDVT